MPVAYARALAIHPELRSVGRPRAGRPSAWRDPTGRDHRRLRLALSAVEELALAPPQPAVSALARSTGASSASTSSGRGAPAFGWVCRRGVGGALGDSGIATALPVACDGSGGEDCEQPGHGLLAGEDRRVAVERQRDARSRQRTAKTATVVPTPLGTPRRPSSAVVAWVPGPPAPSPTPRARCTKRAWAARCRAGQTVRARAGASAHRCAGPRR